MSCSSCGTSSCVCIPQCLESCPEVLDYSATNINLAGVGCYDSTLDRVFQFRGVRSTNANLTVALNATLHTVDITLSNAVLEGTETFANAATRANAVPGFEGQLGVQLDTDVLYIATGVGAGAWTGTFVQMDKTVAGTAGQNTVLTLQNHVFTFDCLGTGDVVFTNSPLISFDSCGCYSLGGTAEFENCPISLIGTTYLNFESTSRMRYAGVAVPANAVIITSGTAGQLSSKLINTFISTSNTQTGYVAFTNPVVRKTCDTTTVTLPQLAEIVGTLIECLKGVLLPAV